MSIPTPISIPQTLAENGSGAPAPNSLFLGSSAYGDLRALLANPNSNLATDISSAASGALSGLVFNGRPSELIKEAAFTGMQIEAQQQAQQAQENRLMKEKQEKVTAEQRDEHDTLVVSRERETHDNDNKEGVFSVLARGGRSPFANLADMMADGAAMGVAGIAYEHAKDSPEPLVAQEMSPSSPALTAAEAQAQQPGTGLPAALVAMSAQITALGAALSGKISGMLEVPSVNMNMAALATPNAPMRGESLAMAA